MVFPLIYRTPQGYGQYCSNLTESFTVMVEPSIMAAPFMAELEPTMVEQLLGALTETTERPS